MVVPTPTLTFLFFGVFLVWGCALEMMCCIRVIFTKIPHQGREAAVAADGWFQSGCPRAPRCKPPSLNCLLFISLGHIDRYLAASFPRMQRKGVAFRRASKGERSQNESAMLLNDTSAYTFIPCLLPHKYNYAIAMVQWCNEEVLTSQTSPL